MKVLLNNNLYFHFKDQAYMVHCGAIYHDNKGKPSNIPCAAMRSTGIEPYAKSLGQKPLTEEEKEHFKHMIDVYKELSA